MVSVPTLVTLLRGFLVPFFIMAILYKNFKLALFIFFVAAISDALDGYLARKLNQITTLGVILDPLADKALINSGFILLSYVDRIIPVWLTIFVISRDIILLIGGWLLATFGKINRIKPTKIGKATAFSQFLTLLLTLVNTTYGFIPLEFIKILYIITAMLTILSAVSYTAIGIRELSSEEISN
ncbi:MAG: CDP-alcohol phosphatidyltransferase family protein [Desulfurobacteriaceae bacterium]